MTPRVTPPSTDARGRLFPGAGWGRGRAGEEEEGVVVVVRVRLRRRRRMMGWGGRVIRGRRGEL